MKTSTLSYHKNNSNSFNSRHYNPRSFNQSRRFRPNGFRPKYQNNWRRSPQNFQNKDCNQVNISTDGSRKSSEEYSMKNSPQKNSDSFLSGKSDSNSPSKM